MFSLLLVPALLAASTTSQPQAPATQSFAGHSESATIFAKGVQSAGSQVCYKIRAYIFERNDAAAPKLVRETTCPPARPHLNRSELPKARMIPAN